MSDERKPGNYKQARGVIPWQPGDEPAEVSIRRYRDGAKNAEDILAYCHRLETRIAALEKQLYDMEAGK